MNVTLRQLRAFIAVAEAQHFTRAAERLDISQSSVSTLVRELEENLGLRLFDRHTRMLRLTHAGGEILPLARKAMADLDSVLGSSAELRTLGRGRVSIAAASLQAALLLPLVIRDFQAAHPGVKVTVYDMAEHEVIPKVRKGEVDFGVGSAQGGERDIGAQRLLTDVFVAVMQRGHPLARRVRLSWREIAEIPLIGPPPDNAVRLQLDGALAAAGIALTRRFEVQLPLTILGMVEAGLGIAVMTTAMNRLAEALGLAIRPVDEPVIEREISLLFHADRSLSPAAQNFRNMLVSRRDWGAPA
ncbi:MAG: LysR family transcriptional regulator [Rubrivivax sp.]|nr:LysR family transcriptional regulator [Rubrivivax sp.]MCL4698575.1 LysR family transcriptional regulator [Burkholderiaceae bacterium]